MKEWAKTDDRGDKKLGSIYLPKSDTEKHEKAHVVAEVIATGDACYTNKQVTPGEPWCKVGDFIVVRPYSGTCIKISGSEYRLVNEDTVEAVVTDPDAIERA